MPVRRILAVTHGVFEAVAEQQGAARGPARRAERLRSGGPNVASRVRDVRKISIARVVADAPGKQLAPARFREVSPPGFSMCHVDRLRSFPDPLCQRPL